MKIISKLLSFCFILIFYNCENNERLPEYERTGLIKITEAIENVVEIQSVTSKELKYEIVPHMHHTASEYKYFSYESSDEGIFAINEQGIINAFKNGRAQLIVTAKGDENIAPVKGSCVIEVVGQKFVQSIALDESAKTINFDESAGFMEFDLAGKYTINPTDALVKDVAFESSAPNVADVDENGRITAFTGGNAKITIKALDGSNVSAVCEISVYAPILTWYDEEKVSWSVTTSHAPSEGGVQFLFDDILTTSNRNYLNMSKPSKNGIPADAEVFLVVDMKQELKFNKVTIYHRTDLSYPYLRVWGFDVYGSHDGTDFEKVQEDAIIPDAETSTSVFVGVVDLDTTVTYRYFKFIYKKFTLTSGGSMAIQELKIGYDERFDTSGK